ncbi:MAG: hypothetical protein AB1728_13240 [Bacteroidota bacterium]
MNTVEIKIVINGKEAIATLQLTDENVQKVAERLNVLGTQGSNSIELLRQKAAMLTQLLENSELGSPQFNELAEMSADANKELAAAEAQLFKVTGTSGNARMAVTSFSQTLSDSTQFQNGFRYGVQAIGNNLEQMISYLGAVKAESAATGQSMTKMLTGALAGPGGVMIALTAVIALLQILPGLFENSGDSVKEFSLTTLAGERTLSDYAQAIENVQKEFREMNVEEIKDKFIEIDNQIQQSKRRADETMNSWSGQLKAFLNMRFGTTFDLTGGEGERTALLERTKKVGEEELANRSRVKILDDEIAALREAQNKKGSDAKAIADQIEVKERERANLLKSTNERLSEQAAIAIRLQKAQVDAMEEGINKERAAAQLRFTEAKAELDEELREKKITQQQYTQFLALEEQKRDNDFRAIEQQKNTFAIETRAAALKRMSEMEHEEALSRIDLDERVALSKAKTEQERLEITRDFAMKRVEAEANAQAEILLIERQALQAKLHSATGSDAEKIRVDLQANTDALNKILSDVAQQKAQITVDFVIGTQELAPLDSIAGKEAEIARLQKEYARETNAQQRELLQQRIQEHQQALQVLTYSEEQFVRDVYSASKNLYSQVSDLINQNIQQDADRKLRALENERTVRQKEIENDKRSALEQLQRERRQRLEHAKTAAEKERINLEFNNRQQSLENEFALRKEQAQQETAAKEQAIKVEAFNAQKNLSYVTAVINIAEGITKALASAPPPFNLILAGLTAAAGAVQLAVISNSQPPGMKEGGLFTEDGVVKGPGGPKDDKVNARLSNGEFVSNAETTKKSLPMLEEANRKKIAITETEEFRRYVYRQFGEDVAVKFADGGLVGEVKEKALPLMKFRVPELLTEAMVMQRVVLPEGREIDLSSVEQKLDKLDELIRVVKQKEFAAYLDRKKMTKEISIQQKIDREGRF